MIEPVWSGLSSLDELTGGFLPGQLILITGNPGAGKSALALQIARFTALMEGRAAAVFSLDMNRDELACRLLAAEASVDLQLIDSVQLDDAQSDRIARRRAEIETAPLHLDTTDDLYVGELANRAKKAHDHTPLAVVVVDHLQVLLSEPGEGARSLKFLARDLNAPVACVVQPNALGCAVADADVVIQIGDEWAWGGRDRCLALTKRRNGRLGMVGVTAEFEYARFANLELKDINASEA